MPTFVGAASSKDASSTSCTVTLPAGIQDDDYAVLVHQIAGATHSGATPTGWTLLDTFEPGGSGAMRLWTRRLTATDSGTDVTVTLGAATRWDLGVYVSRGTDLTTPIAANGPGTSVNGTFDVVCPSLSPSASATLLAIAGGATIDSGAIGAFTPPTGMTERVDESTQHGSAKNAVLGLFDEAVSAGATGTRTATNTVNMRSLPYAIALQGPTGANAQPVADAGPDQEVVVESVVTLDGTGSSDSDGTIAGYQWRQISGQSVTLSSTTASQPTFNAPASSGMLTFGLIVTDNDGDDSVEDTVAVNVTLPPQFARPDGDVDNAAGWSSVPVVSPISQAIDEAVADDADYIESPADPVDAAYECSLSNPTEKPTVVRYRLSSSAATTSSMTVELRQAAVVIASWTETDVPATVTEYSHSLSTAEQDAITDLTDLRLRFSATAS